MILFRKRKVQAILRAYATEYDKKIPEKVIARDELVSMKELNLEELAAQYDALEGYQYYKSPAQMGDFPDDIQHAIPDKSVYCPSGYRFHKHGVAIINSLKELKRAKFVQRHTGKYNIFPQHAEVFKEFSGLCWKNMI